MTTPDDICVGRAVFLLPFVKETFKIKFKAEPDYKKLRHQLTSILLDIDKVPDLVFDWSKFAAQARRADSESNNM